MTDGTRGKYHRRSAGCSMKKAQPYLMIAGASPTLTSVLRVQHRLVPMSWNQVLMLLFLLTVQIDHPVPFVPTYRSCSILCPVVFTCSVSSWMALLV